MNINVEDKDNNTNVPHFLDDIELVERKRIKLDSFGRKRWSLTEREKDQEVLAEMGVGVLESDDEQNTLDCTETVERTDMLKSESCLKRGRSDIENVNPNLSRTSRNSPRSKGSSCTSSPSQCKSTSISMVQKKETQLSALETSIDQVWSSEMDEETPHPLLPIAGLSKAAREHDVELAGHTSPTCSSSVRSCDWLASGGSSSKGFEGSCPRIESSCSVDVPDNFPINIALRLDEQESLTTRTSRMQEGRDAFHVLSDEMMLSIFKWLPKRTLVQCMLVCRRWHRVATDESFWQRLELGGRFIAKDALTLILARQPAIIRLAGAEIGSWHPNTEEPSRITFLDLSMATIQTDTLNALLARSPSLRKLSLENLPIDTHTCKYIGNCRRMETLNMTLTEGCTPEGMISIVQGCVNLQALNVSWSRLCPGSLKVLCTQAPPRLVRLNIAGCRRHLTDDMVVSLCKRCSRLEELDLSDASVLSARALAALLSHSHTLEHLALSRCYSLPPQMLTKLSTMRSLQYLEVWGLLTDTALEALKATLPGLHINQFMHSAIARPTVGTRRTSIWGIRTRD